MGSLFSRFTFNSRGSRFHSSGLAANQNDIGTAASGKTFATRQKIDANRQRIAQYGAAALNHDYRRDALPEMKEIQQKNHEKYKQQADELFDDASSNRDNYLKKQREERERRNKKKKNDEQGMLDHRAPIDVVRPGKQAFNAGAPVKPGIAVPIRETTTFREPPSRGYNPYK